MRISDWSSDVCSSDLTSCAASSYMRGAVGLPAVKITKAGLPRIFTRLAVVLIAAKSNALGRQGINTSPAASTAALAALSAWGGVSIKIGRAHVCTAVTNAHLVCRLLLEHTKHQSGNNMLR